MGVCRGLQVIAVANGGSLIDDLGTTPHVLPDVEAPVTTSPARSWQPLLGNHPHRELAAPPGHPPSSGAGWEAYCPGPRTAVVEAAEWTGSEWPALGVQWHPELDATGYALFGWLVKRAAPPKVRVAS